MTAVYSSQLEDKREPKSRIFLYKYLNVGDLVHSRVQLLDQ